jgi:hypothetical protein
LPRVGGYSRIDLEAVAALKPDLVMAWESGNNMTQVDKLKALGLTVYVSQPNTIENIADQLEKMGRLAGTKPLPTRPPSASASDSKPFARPMPASRRCASFIKSGHRR